MATLGLTDIIGPIMVGPSSSHTAGAVSYTHLRAGTGRSIGVAGGKAKKERMMEDIHGGGCKERCV